MEKSRFFCPRKLALLLGLFGLLALGMGSCGGADGKKHNEKDKEIPEPVEAAGPKHFSMVVNYGPDVEVAVFEGLPFDGGMTIYEGMTAAQDSGTLQFQDSAFAGIGKFITGINGVSSQPENKQYWLYCVNDTAAIEGVEEIYLEEGTEVQWFLGEETPCVGFGE